MNIMATLINLFRFTGKLGDLVGCKGPNGYYLRKRAQATTRKPTVKQLESRARFALVNAFFAPLRDVVYLGARTPRLRGHKTAALSEAVSWALRYAVEGAYPDFQINPAKVRITTGAKEKPANATFDLNDSGVLEVGWRAQGDAFNGYGDDRIWLMAYDVANKQLRMEERLRGDGGGTLDLAGEPKGSEWFVYVSAAERDLSLFSNSVYLGRVER